MRPVLNGRRPTGSVVTPPRHVYPFRGAARMETPLLLKLGGIRKAFGGVAALRGVSFELMAGEIHALVGENGAGKSTFIKVITGAHAPDGGTFELGGKPVGHFDPRMARG